MVERGITRRALLSGLAASAAGGSWLGCSRPGPGGDGWNRGPLRHLVPAVSDRAIHLKLSLETPRDDAPVLRVGDRDVPGERTDSAGRFWAFRVGGLAPGAEHRLELRDPRGEPLCDAWPLRTFPAPDASPDRLRVLSFTCAGGISTPIPPALFDPFRPPAYRARLFDLALAAEPDFAIANGDHVYYDLPQMQRIQEHPVGALVAGMFDSISHRFDADAPLWGGENEASLIGVGDDQIASIYGVRFRSTPVFFITDDHDYFENDDATPERTTFPPARFQRALRDALQRLYFPELPADSTLPADIPGLVTDGATSRSLAFGAIRYGDLLSGALYDCGGHLSLGEDAGLVPPAVERWLLDAAAREDTRHHAHFPSHPMGWTAGKWREWVPDYLEHEDAIVASVGRDADGGKFGWQRGWWEQHQRIVRALCAQKSRAALSVSGDLHALGTLRIERSGDLDLAANPLVAVLSGTPGTGSVGWPSRARGVAPRVPDALEAEPVLAYEERNGFTRLDFDRDTCRIETRRCPEGYVAPEALATEVASERVIRRPG